MSLLKYLSARPARTGIRKISKLNVYIDRGIAREREREREKGKRERIDSNNLVRGGTFALHLSRLSPSLPHSPAPSFPHQAQIVSEVSILHSSGSCPSFPTDTCRRAADWEGGGEVNASVRCAFTLSGLSPGS